MKKLEIKTFEKFWLRNCYYHDLYSGLSCIGIGTDGVMWMNVALPAKDFGIAEEAIFSEKDNENLYGYAKYGCNITEKTLKESIDAGYPVIAGVDRFNLEKRVAINVKLHAPHFLLVYGYDENERTVNIIDHDEVSSFKFKEKIISADNFFLANNEYKEGIGRKYTHTCKVLYRTGGRDKRGISAVLKLNPIKEATAVSKRNLEALKEIFSKGGEAVAEKFDVITEYLRKLKRSLRCLSETEMFKSGDEALNGAFNAYSKLLTVLWKGKFKNDFGFVADILTEIFKIIDTIEINEEKLFKNLLKKGENKNGNY